MLPRRHRLSRTDFQLIYGDQTLPSTRVITSHAQGQLLKFKLVKYLPNSAPIGLPENFQQNLKIGLVLSKKVVKQASKRNHLKRQLRAILRATLRTDLAVSPNSALPQSARSPKVDRYFLVITFLPFTQQPSFSQLQAETLKLLSQLHLT